MEDNSRNQANQQSKRNFEEKFWVDITYPLEGDIAKFDEYLAQLATLHGGERWSEGFLSTRRELGFKFASAKDAIKFTSSLSLVHQPNVSITQVIDCEFLNSIYKIRH